jgi:hypothetical protein
MLQTSMVAQASSGLHRFDDGTVLRAHLPSTDPPSTPNTPEDLPDSVPVKEPPIDEPPMTEPPSIEEPDPADPAKRVGGRG